ncbi:DUF3466 family protein [Cellulomonas sp. NPDC055163]
MARSRALVLAAALALGLAVAAPTATAAAPPPPTYSVQDVGSLAGGATSAQGVSSRGVVAGTSQTADGLNQAFVRDPRTGALTQIPASAFWQTEAAAINDRGQVVGTGTLPGEGGTRAFVWDTRNGTVEDLGTLGGSYSRGTAINNRGVVVGASTSGPGVEQVAFVFDPCEHAMVPVPTFGLDDSAAYGINDRGVVVGDARTTEGVTHGFRWDPRTGASTDLGVLPGTVVSFARDVNNRGDVVGWAADVEDGSSQAFVWSARTGTLAPVPGLTGGSSEALAINARGTVAGNVARDGEHQAFVWHPGAETVAVLPPLVNGESSFADDLSDSGRVVGVSGSAAVLWTPGKPRS